jgi:hypothetical protein
MELKFFTIRYKPGDGEGPAEADIALAALGRQIGRPGSGGPSLPRTRPTTEDRDRDE